MRFKAALISLLIILAADARVLAAGPKLEGAYKFVGLKLHDKSRLG